MTKLKHNPYSLFAASLGIIMLFSYCNSGEPSLVDRYDYGTSNDSARHYFLKGWEEILDNGRWTESEEAFRKAIEFDEDWPLGKSLVGRISRNTEERIQLLKELQLVKDEVGEDERLLLEVNMLSLEAANNRDQGIKNTPESSQYRRQLAEKNFGAFARKYPEDDYFKAEYIEFLHANHGAQMALDSLYALATPEQMELGFYIYYAAALELELGNLEKALTLENQLNAAFQDPSFTAPLMLRAQILSSQDSLEAAYQLVEKVVQMDSNHLIALGQKRQLERQLKQTGQNEK